MASSTRLLAPWDDVQTTDKVRVQTGIPRELRMQLFTSTFPRYGSSDKILGRLLHIFHVTCMRVGVSGTVDEREQRANEILSALGHAAMKLTNSDIHQCQPPTHEQANPKDYL